MDEFNFLNGLNAEDTALVANDIRLYGNTTVEIVDGKKRRIAPQDIKIINQSQLMVLKK